MAPRTDLVMFLDLEATGSGDDEDIVEIGLSLVETESLTEVDSFSALVEPREEKWLGMQQVVVDMHTKSGLFADIEKIREYPSSRHEPAEVDKEIEGWLKGIIGTNTTHIPPGGSGICHYDRKFLKRDLPLLNAHLGHWHYDVGTAERMFRFVGLAWPKPQKNHRALDDARWHASEFRYILHSLRQLDPEKQARLAQFWPEVKPDDTFVHVD